MGVGSFVGLFYVVVVDGIGRLFLLWWEDGFVVVFGGVVCLCWCGVWIVDDVCFFVVDVGGGVGLFVLFYVVLVYLVWFYVYFCGGIDGVGVVFVVGFGV